MSNLSPVGIGSDYYFLGGSTIDSVEFESGIMFSKDSSGGNEYFNNVINSLGIRHLSRFNKIVNCLTDNLKVTGELINSYRESVESDIIKTNPKVIIALGSKPAEWLLGSKFTSISVNGGRLYNAVIGGIDFPVIVTYSPTYFFKASAYSDSDNVMNSFSEEKSTFMKDLMYSIKFVNGELTDISSKRMITALNYNDFDNFCKLNIDNSEITAFDIETNAADVHSVDFRIIGFSLSSDGVNGIYVVKEALEYSMDNNDWNLIVNRLIEILKSKKIVVHNSMYEVPACVNRFGFRIDNFEDTLCMARLLLGGGTGAGLKIQCQTNLGYPEWEEDLINYKDSFDSLRGIFTPTPAGKSREQFDMLKNECNSSLKELKNKLEIRISDYIKSKVSEGVSFEDAYKESLESKDNKIISEIDKLNDVLSLYYSNDDYELDTIMNSVSAEIVRLIDNHMYSTFLPYSSIPMKILSKYGAIDSIGTMELYHKLSERITNESTSEVDLWKGYNIVKSQFSVAISMELNGLLWDDNVAQNEYDWFRDTAVSAMKGLLLSGYLDDNIFNSSKEDWVRLLIETDPDTLSDLIGSKFRLTSKGIKRDSGGREVLFKNIPNLISEDYWKLNRDKVINYFKYVVADCDESKEDYTYFKYVYNPGSPKQEEFLSKILVTDDVHIAKFIHEMTLLLDDKESSINTLDCLNKNSPNCISSPDYDLFMIIKNTREYNASIDEDESKSDKDKISNYDMFKQFKEKLCSEQLSTNMLSNLLVQCCNYKLENGQDGSILELYDYYKIIGKDNIEDKSTWSPEFEFLINYRLYKKCVKMMSTYILGSKVGRGSVYVCDEKDIEENKDLAVRKRLYDGNKSYDEIYIMQPSFGCCSADSLRWRSGIHTIPATASVKNIYKSRYKGGVIFAPDYSAQEMRCIAGLSHCTPMIDAFKQGLDIHKFNAASIFRKPIEEVTSLERRRSKNFTFAMLYGSSEQGMANSFLGGDLAYAHKLTEDFYSAFPQIADWIKERHKEMRQDGRVSVPMTGMFLNINPAELGGESRALRVAQNAPVQSASSNMAGYVLARIDKYLRDNNMKSKPICFIHDSLEFDIHPQELYDTSTYIVSAMNDIPNEEFHIPSHADLTLGVSMGQELEVDKIEGDDKCFEMTLTGLESDFDLLIESWKQVYKSVEWEDVEDKEERYVPIGTLFMPKATISRNFGTNVYDINRKVKIIV